MIYCLRWMPFVPWNSTYQPVVLFNLPWFCRLLRKAQITFYVRGFLHLGLNPAIIYIYPFDKGYKSCNRFWIYVLSMLLYGFLTSLYFRNGRIAYIQLCHAYIILIHLIILTASSASCAKNKNLHFVSVVVN